MKTTIVHYWTPFHHDALAFFLDYGPAYSLSVLLIGFVDWKLSNLVGNDPVGVELFLALDGDGRRQLHRRTAVLSLEQQCISELLVLIDDHHYHQDVLSEYVAITCQSGVWVFLN